MIGSNLNQASQIFRSIGKNLPWMELLLNWCLRVLQRF